MFPNPSNLLCPTLYCLGNCCPTHDSTLYCLGNCCPTHDSTLYCLGNCCPTHDSTLYCLGNCCPTHDWSLFSFVISDSDIIPCCKLCLSRGGGGGGCGGNLVWTLSLCSRPLPDMVQILLLVMEFLPILHLSEEDLTEILMVYMFYLILQRSEYAVSFV